MSAPQDGAEGDAAKTDATRADATRADATRADATRADATRADAMQADATRADAMQADATGTDTAETDAAKMAATPQAAELGYEAASARIEEIIRRLDSGEASLDETLALLSEGKTLIELCARELSAVGDALQELRLDELVERLEGSTGG